MKAGLLLNGSGAIIYITSHGMVLDDDLKEKFKAKGIHKCIVYELPVVDVKDRYGAHFNIVEQDLRETDDLRILDYDGSRAFGMFSFKEMGDAQFMEL